MRFDIDGNQIPDPENAVFVKKGVRKTPKEVVYRLRTLWGMPQHSQTGAVCRYKGRTYGFWTQDGRYYETREKFIASQRQQKKKRKRIEHGKKPVHKIRKARKEWKRG